MHRFQCKQGHTWQRSGRATLSFAGCPICTEGSPRQASLSPDGLKRLQRAAAKRGGKCLEDSYVGVMHHYEFRCAHGHTWRARGASVLEGTWCPHCTHRMTDRDLWREDGIARLHAIAAQHGGQCLSDNYTGLAARYRFRCQQGHEWEPKGEQVINRGNWCPECVNNKKRLGIEAAQQMARERGGQCLSTEYRRVTVKLHWICHHGHSWYSAFSNIRAGHWCPECAHMSQITNKKSKAMKRYISAPK